jgi:hypothetical protein
MFKTAIFRGAIVSPVESVANNQEVYWYIKQATCGVKLKC